MDVSLERTTYARSLSLLSFFNQNMSTETKQHRHLSKKCISWCVALASVSDIVENLKELCHEISAIFGNYKMPVKLREM